jgi:hypothetical protein
LLLETLPLLLLPSLSSKVVAYFASLGTAAFFSTTRDFQAIPAVQVYALWL